MVAMVTLWAISTAHHVVLAKAELRAPQGEPAAAVDVSHRTGVR